MVKTFKKSAKSQVKRLEVTSQGEILASKDFDHSHRSTQLQRIRL